MGLIELRLLTSAEELETTSPVFEDDDIIKAIKDNNTMHYI